MQDTLSLAKNHIFGQRISCSGKMCVEVFLWYTGSDRMSKWMEYCPHYDASSETCKGSPISRQKILQKKCCTGLWECRELKTELEAALAKAIKALVDFNPISPIFDDFELFFPIHNGLLSAKETAEANIKHYHDQHDDCAKNLFAPPHEPMAPGFTLQPGCIRADDPVNQACKVRPFPERFHDTE